MGRLQRALADPLKSGKVKLVTFTVDPVHDDLKTLRDYANARQADPDNWLFLTGEEKTIHKLLHDQFKQAIEQRLGPEVKPGEEFDHSTRLILVDKTGVIRGMYDGLPNDKMPGGKEAFEENLKRLRDRVGELTK